MFRLLIIMIQLSMSTFLLADSNPISRKEENYLNQKMLAHLNAWCPDAWCAGDYTQHWLKFYFDSKQNAWALDFLTSIKYKENIYTPTIQSSLESHANLVSQITNSLRSTCYFSQEFVFQHGNFGPVIVEINENGSIKTGSPKFKLNNEGSTQLAECTIKAEKILSQTLNKQ